RVPLAPTRPGSPRSRAVAGRPARGPRGRLARVGAARVAARAAPPRRRSPRRPERVPAVLHPVHRVPAPRTPPVVVGGPLGLLGARARLPGRRRHLARVHGGAFARARPAPWRLGHRPGHFLSVSARVGAVLVPASPPSA